MKPQRIQLKRTKGWRMPANTVKVTRPGPFGNPFKVGMLGVTCNADAVEKFRKMLERADLNDGMYFHFTPLRIGAYLRGKNLACWCKLGDPCHADVLLEIANSGSEETK
jgi:Domain of unknown function (DUF4326)